MKTASAPKPKASRPRSKPKLDPAHCRFDLEARQSPIHRYGLFALERIPAKRRVIEYTGERITDEQGWRRRFRKHVYLFSLSDGWVLDGAVGGSGAEFINHSCEPNIIAREEKGRIWYSSVRTIHPGEELLVDYQLDSDEEYACICGAPSCRGKLNAPKKE
jgi:SET domain-containing protein